MITVKFSDLPEKFQDFFIAKFDNWEPTDGLKTFDQLAKHVLSTQLSLNATYIDYGKDFYSDELIFKSEQQYTWFLLQWSQ